MEAIGVAALMNNFGEFIAEDGSKLFESQFTSRNHETLNLTGPLVNLGDLGISKISFHR
jgi:hypothetical protein